jgi:hypothetical protein
VISSRTNYRKKRLELIKECIYELIDLSYLSKKDLEKIHLKFFKKLKKTIKDRYFEEIRRSRFLIG